MAVLLDAHGLAFDTLKALGSSRGGHGKLCGRALMRSFTVIVIVFKR
jgi:hypothetical protein